MSFFNRSGYYSKSDELLLCVSSVVKQLAKHKIYLAASKAVEPATFQLLRFKLNRYANQVTQAVSKKFTRATSYSPTHLRVQYHRGREA